MRPVEGVRFELLAPKVAEAIIVRTLPAMSKDRLDFSRE